MGRLPPLPAAVVVGATEVDAPAAVVEVVGADVVGAADDEVVGGATGTTERLSTEVPEEPLSLTAVTVNV